MKSITGFKAYLGRQREMVEVKIQPLYTVGGSTQYVDGNMVLGQATTNKLAKGLESVSRRFTFEISVQHLEGLHVAFDFQFNFFVIII
jgi:hypothetical protein